MEYNLKVYKTLSILDTMIAIFAVFPCTVMFWRGIWDLIGWYVLRGEEPLNYWVMMLVAMLQMVGLLLLPSLQKFKERPPFFPNMPHAKDVEFWIASRLFMYLHTLTYMFFWHGFWELQNYYLGTDWRYNLLSFILCYMALAMLGGCRSTMWPPFFISLDSPGVFVLASRFNSSPRNGSWREYVTEAYFVQIIVLGVAIITWRSAFNMMDELIYPSDSDAFNLRSNALTAAIGVSGCTLLLCLQVPLGAVSNRLDDRPYLKTIWEDCVYLVVFIFLSLQWRGIWNLNAEYFIKELPLGGWVNHILGTTGLMALQTFSEVSAFGMLRDGIDPKGQAFFPVQYLRILMKTSYDMRAPKSQHCPLSVHYNPEEESKEGQMEVDHKPSGTVNVAFVDIENEPCNGSQSPETTAGGSSETFLHSF